MNEAATIQGFQSLLEKEESPLLEALRQLMKLEKPEEVSDTAVVALAGWKWR